MKQPSGTSAAYGRASYELALEIVRTLRQAGYEAYFAGGAVRDQLLGLEPSEVDVATSADPQTVQRLFPRSLAVGASFGVIAVLGRRVDHETVTVQVATFRREGPYSDSRHPDRVEFCSVAEDARRRDFTINGMYYDPLTGAYLDFVGGRADLQARLLRAIGDPHERFAEDKLRLLRAVRFAATYDLRIEEQTAAALRCHAADIVQVSAERIAEELRRMLIHPARARAMRLCYEYSLFTALFPEWVPWAERTHPDVQTTLWEHTLRVLDLLVEPSFPLALAGLLHELNDTQTVESICRRLKLSNEEKERSVWLVRHHRQVERAQEMRLAQLKPLLAHEGIEDLLALAEAEARALGRPLDHVGYCRRLLREWPRERIAPAPLLTGNDLIELGLEPGPLFKELLDEVRQQQLDERIGTRAEALNLVKERLARKGIEVPAQQSHSRSGP